MKTRCEPFRIPPPRPIFRPHDPWEHHASRVPNDGVDYEEIGKFVMAWMKARIPDLVDPS